MNKTIAQRGFTLIELLVVVSIIAFISALAVQLLSGSEQEAKESLNIANIKRTTSAVKTHSTLHSGSIPNRVDSLLSTDVTAGASRVFDAGDVAEIMYFGTDADDDGVLDTGANFKGIHDHCTDGYGQALILEVLSQADVDMLAAAGLTTVMDINNDTDKFASFNHENYVKEERELAAGDYVAMVSPTTPQSGMLLYRDFGVDLADTTDFPRSGFTLSDTGRDNALNTKRFFVFGIGKDCTLIGDQLGGLEEIPISPIVTDGHYDRYLLVIAMPRSGSPTDTTPPYPVAILDPTGKNAHLAQSWATRTNRN